MKFAFDTPQFGGFADPRLLAQLAHEVVAAAAARRLHPGPFWGSRLVTAICFSYDAASVVKSGPGDSNSQRRRPPIVLWYRIANHQCSHPISTRSRQSSKSGEAAMSRVGTTEQAHQHFPSRLRVFHEDSGTRETHTYQTFRCFS